MEGKIEGRSEGVLLASRIFKLLQANSSLKNEVIAQECDCSLKEVQDVRVAFKISVSKVYGTPASFFQRCNNIRNHMPLIPPQPGQNARRCVPDYGHLSRW